jgi:hypothetical protein
MPPEYLAEVVYKITSASYAAQQDVHGTSVPSFLVVRFSVDAPLFISLVGIMPVGAKLVMSLLFMLPLFDPARHVATLLL